MGNSVLILQALPLAMWQLLDRRILLIIAKSLMLTLVLLMISGYGAWHLGRVVLKQWPILAHDFQVDLVLAAILFLFGWMIFRIAAMAVMGLYSDAVANIVEESHYPDAAACARDPSLSVSIRLGMTSLGRAVGYNLLAMPIYIGLLVTGIGTLIAMILVNGVALGKDLNAMMAARFPRGALEPIPRKTRHILGVVVAGLFSIPVVNFVAPVLGVAIAVHVLHLQNEKRPR